MIAEFLKSDFHYPAFRQYQDSLRNLVARPNIEDAAENAKRRALLFIRHLSLWKEIPVGTEWYEVEVNSASLGGIRVFPRAQWRKIAGGHFSIDAILEGMRKRQNAIDATFLSKINSIRDHFFDEETGRGAVILIGLNEREPLTVLDGNHRLVAAMLESPNRVDKLRFLCGLSPQMTECCWYNTNLTTLFHYGRNVLTHSVRNPEAELARLLQSTS